MRIHSFSFIFIVLEPLAYGLGVLIRYIHNRSYGKEKERVARYYMACDEFNQKSIESAVEDMAQDAAMHDNGGAVVISRRTIALMQTKYRTHLTLEELCDCFMKKYFATLAAKQQSTLAAEEKKSGLIPLRAS